MRRREVLGIFFFAYSAISSAVAAAAADAVLDACLAQDPSSKVACETAVKDNFMLVFGEITSRAEVDYAGGPGTAGADM
jgi:hypothetical protein